MEDNRNNNVINNCPFEPIQSIANDSYHQPVPTRIHGERRTSSANLVEKIKMAFSPEKRKSMVLNSKKQRGDSTDRTDYDMSSSSSSSPPSSPGDIRSLPMLTQFHSRQSTQNSQLSEITEENVIIQNNV
jgi:hypothetical protein